MNLKLREGTASDREVVLRIARDLPNYFNARGLARLERDLGDKALEVCELDGRVAGFAIIHKTPETVCEILWMAVDKSRQGRGLGRALVHHLAAKLAFEHVRLLKVRTLGPSADYPPYEGTRRFYEGLGFLPVEDLEFYEPWGRGNPCRIYAKPLYYLTVGNPMDAGVRKGSSVTLREITQEMVREVCRLSVLDHQHQFVAHNAVSLAQARFEPRAWFRAIFAGDTPVGFAMLFANEDEAEYILWRFMIDGRYQRFGFGSRALGLVIDHVKGRPGAEELLTSVGQAPGGPQEFYEGLGFVPTGKYDEDGEAYLRLEFK